MAEQEVDDLENNLPVKFLSKRLTGDLCPQEALDSVQFSSRHDAFISENFKFAERNRENELFRPAKSELAELRTAVLKSQEKLGLSAEECSQLQAGSTSWGDIQIQIEKAKATENAKDESGSRFHKICDKFSKALPAFEGWLKLLPNGDYGSIVSGSFAIILAAVKSSREARREVIAALEMIPTTVRRAAKVRSLYPTSEHLDAITGDLAKSILRALRHMVAYLATGKRKAGVLSLIKGSEYQREMLDELERVKELAMEVREEAVLNGQQRLARLEDKVDNYALSVKRQFEAGIITKEGFGDLAACIINSFGTQFASNPRIDSGLRGYVIREEAAISQEKAVQQNNASSIDVRLDHLMKALRCSSESSKDDHQRCLRSMSDLGLPAEDRVKYIMRSDRVKEWLAAPASEPLLINGNEFGNETFSAVTFTAAKLLETVDRLGPVLTLRHFCSLHISSHGDENAVCYMLRDMIGQLLSTRKEWDLSFISAESMARLRKDDLETLLRLFDRLLRQLPEPTVMFWVIDGITFYERRATRTDFVAVVDRMLGILEERSNIVIKLLLSCHGRSNAVRNLLHEDHVFTVPEHIRADYQGWGDRQTIREIEEVFGSSDSESD